MDSLDDFLKKVNAYAEECKTNTSSDHIMVPNFEILLPESEPVLETSDMES